jgi:hypothetical protein
MKTLSEAETFDADIVVPEGSDDMDSHAQDLEAFAQKLTNRTRYLQARKGTLAGDNTWTGDNIFSDLLRVEGTAVVQPDASNQAGMMVERNAHAFQEIVAARSTATSGDYVRLYSGSSPSTVGALLLVVNASWTNGVGWSRTIPGRDSTAIIMRDGNARFVRKASGDASPWVSWPQDTITGFGGEFLSEIFRAARVLAQGNTFADYSNGFRYTTPIDRISPIPLGLCWGNTAVNDLGHVIRNPALTGTMDAVWFPIPIPPFSTFGRVRVQHYQLQSVHLASDQFQLYKRTQHGAWVAQGSVESAATFGSTFTNELHESVPAQVVLDGDEWAFRWKVLSSDPSASGNGIVGISVDWTDYGPSNRVG